MQNNYFLIWRCEWITKQIKEILYDRTMFSLLMIIHSVNKVEFIYPLVYQNSGIMSANCYFMWLWMMIQLFFYEESVNCTKIKESSRHIRPTCDNLCMKHTYFHLYPHPKYYLFFLNSITSTLRVWIQSLFHLSVT